MSRRTPVRWLLLPLLTTAAACLSEARLRLEARTLPGNLTY